MTVIGDTYKCHRDLNKMDGLLDDLRDQMGDLRSQGKGLSRQMWLLYVTFEDFIHLQHPDKAEAIIKGSMTMEEWINKYGSQSSGNIKSRSPIGKLKESTLQSNKKSLAKEINRSEGKAKPWEDDMTNFDPIYTDNLIRKIACMNKLESSGSDLEASLWEEEMESRRYNKTHRGRPIMGTSLLQKAASKTSFDGGLEFYDLDSDSTLSAMRSQKSSRHHHKTKKQKRSKKSKDEQSNKDDVVKHDKRLHKVTKSMHSIIHDLEEDAAADTQETPKCSHCHHCHHLPRNIEPFGDCYTKKDSFCKSHPRAHGLSCQNDIFYGGDDDYNQSIDSTLTFEYSSRLRKCASCSTGIDSGFGTLSSGGKDQLYLADLSSSYGSECGSGYGLGNNTNMGYQTSTDSDSTGEYYDTEHIYEEIRDEDLDLFLNRPIATNEPPSLPERSQCLNRNALSQSEDMLREDDVPTQYPYGGDSSCRYPYGDSWSRKPSHLVVNTTKDNILENSVIGMVFSNLGKFESRDTKTRENLYRLIGNQDNRRTFSESLAIEKKLIEDGLIYARSENRVRGRAEMREMKV